MADINIQKLPAEITGKYRIENNTFLYEVKSNPKDRIQVEIGDSKQPDFKPQRKSSRWDNEVNFSQRAPEDSNAQVITDGEKIKYIAPDYEVHQFEKPDAGEDGGYEMELHFKTLAALQKKTKVVGDNCELVLTTQHKSIKGYKQPPLTEEFQDGWSDEFQTNITVTETDVKDDQGNVLVHRPEDIVNSIAFYHESKGGMVAQSQEQKRHAEIFDELLKRHPEKVMVKLGTAGQTDKFNTWKDGDLEQELQRLSEIIIQQTQFQDYKTGKIGNAKRVKLIAADGKEAWADQNWFPDTNEHKLLLPKSWLDNAVYPVVVDPTFGYQTIGGSNWSLNNLGCGSGNDYTPTDGNGTIDKLTIYTDAGTNANVTGQLYSQHPDFDKITNGQTDEYNFTDASAGWRDIVYSGTKPSVVDSTPYTLAGWSDQDLGWFGRYDSTTSGNRLISYNSGTYNTFPDPLVPTNNYDGYSMSIYATYTASGGETAGVSPVAVNFTVPSVTATYNEVDSASVSPVVTSFTLPLVTALAYFTATVAAVVTTFSLPVVTATYQEVETASVNPVGVTFTLPSVTASVGVGWYNSNWQYRIKVTIQHGKVAADDTDYPVYVDLSDLPSAFFSHVQADGDDIRITKDDGVTECAYDLVKIDTSGQTGQIHLLIDSISSSVDTDFYVYYGYPNATGYGTSDTYGRDNTWPSIYKLVAHGDESSGNNLIDSTGNANFSDNNTIDSLTGKVGNGRDLERDDNGDYFSLSNANAGHLKITGDLTIIMWSKHETLPQNTSYDILDFFDASGGGYLLVTRQSPAGELRFAVRKSLTGYNVQTTGDSVTTGQWDFLMGRYDADGDGGNGLLEASINNGTIHQTTGGPTSIDANTTTSIYIGERTWGVSPPTAYRYDGGLDEIRVIASYLSSNQITTIYNNQSNPSTFYSVGSEETQSSGETASVSPVAVTFSNPSMTATYIQVETANLSPVTTTFSNPSVTATYVQVETASLSPSIVNFSTPTVTATSSSGESASVSPVIINFSNPSVTATYIQVETVSLSAVSVNFSLPSVTATHSGLYNASVNPVITIFNLPSVTATYVQVETAGASPVLSSFLIPSVTASYSQVETASASPVQGTFSIPATTATYVQVETAALNPIVTTFTVPNVTAATGHITASVTPTITIFSIPAVTATYLQVETASVVPVVVNFVVPDIVFRGLWINKTKISTSWDNKAKVSTNWTPKTKINTAWTLKQKNPVDVHF